MRWEEQRKVMQQDAYQKQEVAKYQDQLARQRAEGEHEKQRARNIELVRMQVSRRRTVRPSNCGTLCSWPKLMLVAPALLQHLVSFDSQHQQGRHTFWQMQDRQLPEKLIRLVLFFMWTPGRPKQWAVVLQSGFVAAPTAN